MKQVNITLYEGGQIKLQSKDFLGEEQELFYVLATSTRRIAKMIEDDKEKTK